MRINRKRWQELAVILLIVVPLVAVVWLPILTSETKPWETGRPVPVELPSEDRRVRNEDGLSIISPPNWNVRKHVGMIHLTPKQVFAGRSDAMIIVAAREDPPSELPESDAVEFLGGHAHLLVDRRPSTFDDPALTTWTYSFQRGGHWFEASYAIAEARDEIPAMAQRYLETLRIPGIP